MPKKGTKTFIMLLCLSFSLLTVISNNSINVNAWETSATPLSEQTKIKSGINKELPSKK